MSSSIGEMFKITVFGQSHSGAIGVVVDGADNTFTNMRIASVHIGVRFTRSGNYLRNVHPLYIYEKGLDGHYQDSYAFYDVSSGNWFDTCYSDQFATGFYSGDNTLSTFVGCRAFWYTDKGNKQVGFEFDGKFHSMMNACHISLRYESVEGKYMTVKEKGGKGIVSAPMVNEAFNHDETFKTYTKDNAVWRS